MTQRARPAIERASPDDLMLLACDVGPVPLQVGGILVLDAEPGFDAAAVQAAIAARMATVPRLRQRLCRVPFGCGRPIWTDDPEFDLSAHVHAANCPPPGDEPALLQVAAGILTEPLPWSRPLWSATVVSGLAGGRLALVLVFHHVLADGIGGLAALASLIDGAALPAEPDARFPRALPSARQLAADAVRARLAALTRLRVVPGALRSAVTEARPTGPLAPKTALNDGPAGTERAITVIRADLGRVYEAAKRHGATVNDVALTAVARALRRTLAGRGERLDDVVVSVIVAGRSVTGPDDLGNRLGVMPVRIPAAGDRELQLGRVAQITQAHKAPKRGSSAALMRPVFRTLAALRVLPWAINHQRLVNVFLTNLRGPQQRMRFAGAEITDVLPLTLIAGNVTLSFAILSYAGKLAVVITADPDRQGDVGTLAAAVAAELEALSALAPVTARG